VQLAPIEVPRFFAPSKWVSLETCALAVWAGSVAGRLLLDTPEMMFGQMLHTVRHRYLMENDLGRSPLDQLTAIVGQEASALEAVLGAQGRQACIPLREAIGWRRWDDRMRRLECWAEALDPGTVAVSQRRPITVKRHGDPLGKDVFSEGSEPRWQAISLRLRGQPDEARSNSSGELSITDLKTGFVFTADGEFRAEIVAQMELYATMAEHLSPGKRVRLYVQHSRRDELRWDEVTRREITERLSEVSSRFPAGATLDARSLANPGPHCRNCSFRPVCSAYLERAPSWWPNVSSNPRPLPYDVWGTVTRIQRNDCVRIEMLDAAGRTVQVEGLRPVHGWSRVVPGSMLYLFNLEPTEDTSRHGVRIHPRNFHEMAPGRAWSDALSMSAFL
jgi:hypothetical protein